MCSCLSSVYENAVTEINTIDVTVCVWGKSHHIRVQKEIIDIGIVINSA